MLSEQVFLARVVISSLKQTPPRQAERYSCVHHRSPSCEPIVVLTRRLYLEWNQACAVQRSNLGTGRVGKNTSESKPVIHLRKLLVNARHTKLLSTSFDAVLALISDPRGFEAVDGTACRDSCIGSGNIIKVE